MATLSYAEEKGTVEKIDFVSDASDVEDSRITNFTPEQQKKIIRKVDMRLIPTLGFMYMVSLMDRTNLGVAVVAGMGVDLKLIGNRYSIIVLLFFITYVLCQPPATVVLRKLGPRTFLPAIVVIWGSVMIGFGFVKEWHTLIPLRLVLGIFEAGFFPGSAYLLSCWYQRYELQTRNSFFFMIGMLSSAFSGILGYVFSLLEGHGHQFAYWMGRHFGPTKKAPKTPVSFGPGLSGWRWIFILQGVLTVVIGLVGWYFIVDFPELAAKQTKFSKKFLEQEEVDFIVARIEADRKDVIPEEFNTAKYLRGALDLKVWGFAWIFMMTTVTTYAIAYFLPIILKDGMGFNTAMANILIAPPYLFAAIVMITYARIGDKYHLRSPMIHMNGLFTMIGLALMGFTKIVGVRYFGVFLATAAVNCNVPIILTWQANNIRGQWKRALCSATLVGAGGVGGIIGGTVFRTQDAPNYVPGISACMGAGALTIVVTGLLNLKFWRANKRADAGGKIIEGLPGFRYTQ
ncbi:MFS general substrate transporter [Dothidotthia symphoricarpi CBS 119687]|uniref:MFS general substrate transporter n=1 Tax=Dothidotthia symphoricarpi CBS 119687 TaxID=1392245 RepID=A0A6A6AFU9_9PLEO|nr:MFS general substrate transporter [Dothidotthia symphoricarpi CBS 119687]KAF2129814.1 MFS general substrate transporter [Dothidotthia symphoricarpi CBS 119687]